MSEQARRQLSEKVRALRKLRGWSQMELAERADISVTQIQRVEQGLNVTLDTLDKIGSALNHELY